MLNSVLKKTTRFLIFVHYNRYNELSPHVLYTLSKLRNYYDKIVCVSNSNLSNSDKIKANEFCDVLRIRENKGFDFGAWKEILLEEGWNNLICYDSVTLMNDSCFGPLIEMQEVFDKMENKNVDFWGLTQYENNNKWMPNHIGGIPDYIQSYFLCFTKQVVKSAIFQRFWEKLILMAHIDNVIRVYEVNLSRILQKAGFKYSVYFENKNNDLQAGIVPLYFPEIMVTTRNPFIKVKSIINFQNAEYIMNLIQQTTDYPTRHIEEHFSRAFNPNESLYVLNKCINENKSQTPIPNHSYAVHIYIDNIKNIEDVLSIISKYDKEADIYVTICLSNNNPAINSFLQRCNNNGLQIKIINCNKNDGSILTWLSVSKQLQSYDFASHYGISFSSDKQKNIQQIEIEIDTFFKNSKKVVNAFVNNNRLGFAFLEKYCILSNETNFSNSIKNLCNSLQTKMNLKKSVDFTKIDTPIKPCTDVFWYRPKSITPLNNLSLSESAYKNDMIRTLYAIECMLVYIVWSEGYDFRIVNYDNNTNSVFKLNAMRSVVLEKAKYMDKQFKEFYHSYTWRIGKFFTCLPIRIKTWISLSAKSIILFSSFLC